MGNKKDSLGDRIKTFYENRTRSFLPRRTYTIIRIDGKAFHSLTKKFDKPFDYTFINQMDETAKYLCKNIQGAKFAFVQSDEISILMTDFDKINTSAWFDGNIQKIASISASMATSKFNQLRYLDYITKKYNDGITTITDLYLQNLSKIKLAEFDSRVFTIPSQIEVFNYFVWRQQDTVRNSISSVARTLYSHKELEKVNTDKMQEMCFQKGINWNDYDSGVKRGRFIMKVENDVNNTKRKSWESVHCPIFTQDSEWLLNKIKNINE